MIQSHLHRKGNFQFFHSQFKECFCNFNSDDDDDNLERNSSQLAIAAKATISSLYKPSTSQSQNTNNDSDGEKYELSKEDNEAQFNWMKELEAMKKAMITTAQKRKVEIYININIYHTY
jgi:hypothetical protein